MFSGSQPQIPGLNATLASLNSAFYSPAASPTRSQLWSLNAGTSGASLDLEDEFQSNTIFQPGLFSGNAPTGLGIFYPSLAGSGDHGEVNGVKANSGGDLTARQRNILRTGSIYEAEISAGLIEEPSPDPFSFSSLLVTDELLRDDLELMSNEPVIEVIQEPALPLASQEMSASEPVDEQGRWALARILEASGHTMESLAAALKARSGDAVFSGVTSFTQSSDFQSNSTLPQNNFLRRLQVSPVLAIDPAAIMPVQALPQPYPEQICPAPPETPDPGLADVEDSDAEPISCIIDTSAMAEADPLGSATPLTTQDVQEAEESLLPYKRESDYEPSPSLSAESSNESAFMPSSSRRKIRMRATKVGPKRQSTKRILASSPYIIPQEVPVGPVVLEFPIDYGTPVLDAHRGIELDELKAKAERYRLRNRGLEYDKKWLLSFAGKLTPHGLMTEEYRCYIIGCNQSNRRRDHILIHVGGHLDQRPFACSHCTARFLRKNECKRHELSHTGTRPFTCDICPLGTTAFVRQDLLKRHQKRTHNMDSTRTRAAKRHRQI